MAPIPNRSDDSENKTSVNSDSFEDMLEQVAAHIEAVCQDAISNNMQPQTVIEDCFDHPISAVKELLASMKASDGLTTGDGEVHIDAFAHRVEMLRERNREMLARVEEFSNMLEQIHIAQLHFVDGVNNLANVGIIETGFVAGSLAVLFIIAIMLCSALNLLSERQARVFGLGVVAVCLVIRFGGI